MTNRHNDFDQDKDPNGGLLELLTVQSLMVGTSLPANHKCEVFRFFLPISLPHPYVVTIPG